jgi:CRISPR/Cas system CMR subunit Cmr6 (Cas7 group RAMP superfamily)
MAVNYNALLNKCSRKLELALQSDRKVLLYFLQEDLINQSLFDELSDPKSWLTAEEKAERLVREIKRVVELNSKYYHLLLQYLEVEMETNAKYASLVEILRTEHKALSLKSRKKIPVGGGSITSVSTLIVVLFVAGVAYYFVYFSKLIWG